VLDHGVRQHHVEAAGRERQAGAVGLQELDVGQVLLAGQPRAGVAEAVDQVDRHDLGRLLGEGQRHAAAPAAHIEDAPFEPHPRLVEEGEDLGAAEVLEQRVVVLRPEAQVGVGLDGG
jgi:hypothetical protein